MSHFSENVGIRFIEAMSGRVGGGAGPTPAVALSLEEEIGRFAFDLQIAIPRLRAFLDAPDHVAEIADGTVSWSPFVPETRVNPGRLVLYRADPATRRRKFFDFFFSFPSAAGTIDAVGQKFLHDDRKFDAASDLSTVFLTLSATGNAIAKGVVAVHINELLRQLESIQVTNADTRAEEKAAKEAFFAFMNAELREVYRDMPLLLREEKRLSDEEWRTLRLCVRVMLPDPLPAGGPTADDVIHSLEEYVANASAGEVEGIRNGMQAIALIVPVLSDNVREIRKFVKRELNRTEPSPIRTVLELVHSLVVFPYFAHPKADVLVGYARPAHVPRGAPPLPVAEAPPDREFDVVIAGSGPAGSVLAERLARAGKSVLLLEAGDYVAEKEIDTNELLWTARLYKESGLQQANEPVSIFSVPGPTFRVLQASCVGGGGVVNNAVCFRMTHRRFEQWRALGFPLDATELKRGYDAVAEEMDIGPVGARAAKLNPALRFLEAEFGPLLPNGAHDPPAPGLYECLVNLERRDGAGAGCLGTGLCNVGCGSERKRNALQVHLPRAAATGNCVIVPRAKAVEVKLAPRTGNAPRSVRALVVRMRDGRTLSVRAKQYVLSCGPIGSTEVLLRSEDVREHAERFGLPLGRRFSANLGSPVFAFTRQDEPPLAYPALQIAHYYMPDAARDGFVIETWYNPPGANAAIIPGYLDAHFTRMKQYARTVAAAPLVGSRATGRIRLRDGRLRVDLPIGSEEVERLGRGLVTLAGAFLHGDVDHALVSLGSGRVLRRDADLRALENDFLRMQHDLARVQMLRCGTGHPQGGNAMSDDPAIGVIDASFRLRGVSNLRVCDGSVFPDSSGVNPQWTILALADRCAERMLAGG